MLIYEPAFDPYHSAVRILAMAQNSAKLGAQVAIDAIRIADHYLVYPAALNQFRFPSEFRAIRKLVRDAENPYRTSGGKAVFERMQPIFLAALSSLAAKGLVDGEALKQGVIVASEIENSSDLTVAINRFQQRQTKIGEFILKDLLLIPTNGAGGLKDRSGLIEYKYDVA